MVGNDIDKDKKLESLNDDDVVEPSQIANECTEKKKMNLLDDAELTDNGQAIETVYEDNIDEVDEKFDGDDGSNEALKKDNLESVCDNKDPAPQSASYSSLELPQIANEDAKNSLDDLLPMMDKEDDQTKCNVDNADKKELESIRDEDGQSNPQPFTPSQPSQPLTSKISKVIVWDIFHPYLVHHQ